MEQFFIFVVLGIIALIVLVSTKDEVPKKTKVISFDDYQCPQKKTKRKVKVEHVIDGDTIIISHASQRIKVRLDAIDCPEKGQHWGDTATYGLIKMIGGRHVHIEEHGEDRYDRLLATIYIQDNTQSEWINVNERMVTLGHAWVMRRYYTHLPKERQNQLNRLERWAKSKRVGLWKTSHPIPPWKWRSHN